MSSPRHRRQAALPGPGFARPAAVDGTGLVFTLRTESGGEELTLRFDDLPGSVELRRALVVSIERLCGPNRRWRSVDSARRASYATKEFLQFLSTRPDDPGRPQEITGAVVDAWWRSQALDGPRKRHLSVMRHILLNTDGLSPGAVQALGRRVGRKSPEGPQASYSIDDYNEIRSVAAGMFHTALVRIRANWAHLQRWSAGGFPTGSDDFRRGEALDVIARTGAAPTTVRTKGRYLPQAYRQVLGGDGPEQTWARLFLTCEEVFALAVLLVAAEGWNRGVVDKMTVPAQDPAAGESFDIHRVDIDKPRRPVRLRHTSNNLVDSGPDSPGRLLGQAIEATQPARQALAALGRPTDRLLVCRAAKTGGFLLGVPVTSMPAFNRRVAGQVPAVSLQTLRRTVQVRIRQEPAQNSQAVHDSVYVLRDASTVDAAAETVARGLSEALEHARTVTTMKVVLGDDTEVLLELADHPDLARAVLAGQADTATGACTHFTDSPHAPSGTPCPASFLSCLGCRNAIATRRHLPRLCYLHACLQSLQSTLTEAIWQVDWQEHHLRLTSLLQAHTTAAERQAELRRLSDRDRDLVDQMLRRRLDP